MSMNDIESQMRKINMLSRRELTQDDVYIFPVVLCDNDVDRDFEQFSNDALDCLASLFIGKTGIFDHSMKSSDQTARVFEAYVESDDSKKTRTGETYCRLKGFAYMVRSEKTEDLIREIDAGIKKEVSVNCSVGSKSCSICGADLISGRCDHQRGKTYNGKLCYVILDNPTDAYEWSFVAVPSQAAAGVTKSYETASEHLFIDGAEVCTCTKEFLDAVRCGERDVVLEKGAASGVERYIASLEEKAAQLEAVRAQLCGHISKLAAVHMPSFSEKFVSNGLKSLDISELMEIKRSFESTASQSCGTIQLYGGRSGRGDGDFSQFKI